MKLHKLPLVWLTGILFLMPAAALACLWDYDTLKQERGRFPDTLEIITGKFLRHSKEFYEWRIEDRKKRIAAEPTNASLYDDLAVAYEKTGQVDKAIDTILQVEKFAPGRYETYSNLSTFYFIAGDFPNGLRYVDRALAINPDAHFGRERYQKWLTEYVIAKTPPGKKLLLPLAINGKIEFQQNGFSNFLMQKLHPARSPASLEKEDYQAAVKGVLGMMRFAHHDSPVLLEVLGDLLATGGVNWRVDAKMLAARAYLQASYQVDDEAVNAFYRQKAESVLQMQLQRPDTHAELSLDDLERQFIREIDEASRWYAELHAREIDWIADGLSPELEFDKLYTSEPQVIGEILEELSSWEELEKRFGRTGLWALGALVVLTALLIALVLTLQIRRCRQKAGDAGPDAP